MTVKGWMGLKVSYFPTCMYIMYTQRPQMKRLTHIYTFSPPADTLYFYRVKKRDAISSCVSAVTLLSLYISLWAGSRAVKGRIVQRWEKHITHVDRRSFQRLCCRVWGPSVSFLLLLHPEQSDNGPRSRTVLNKKNVFLSSYLRRFYEDCGIRGFCFLSRIFLG